MIVISDTTPIISLLKAGQLELLQKLYNKVEGESAALIMYDEQKADLLLMDEQKGRRVAKRLNVRHIGTAGILMLAYDKGLIQAEKVKECIDIMLENRIRLGENICNIVMAHVGLDIQY